MNDETLDIELDVELAKTVIDKGFEYIQENILYPEKIFKPNDDEPINDLLKDENMCGVTRALSISPSYFCKQRELEIIEDSKSIILSEFMDELNNFMKNKERIFFKELKPLRHFNYITADITPYILRNDDTGIVIRAWHCLHVSGMYIIGGPNDINVGIVFDALMYSI